MISHLRQILRKIGVGRAFLKLKHATQQSPYNHLRCWLAKKRYLAAIESFPQPTSEGAKIQVHMLLQHKRLHEGMWAFQSLRLHSKATVRWVVHDDGSLTESDISIINRTLPGTRVVRRKDADAMVSRALSRHGLRQCLRFREGLIFALKLIDPVVVDSSDQCIIMDSDVLLYEPADEIIDAALDAGTNPRYSLDNGDRYCLDDETLRSLLGRPCIRRFNPGIFCVRKSQVDLAKMESFLALPGFWTPDGQKGNYYGELTLWGMLLSLQNAQPLSDRYEICASQLGQGVVFGHYCGGGYWSSLFYSRGLPYVFQQLKSEAAERATVSPDP